METEMTHIETKKQMVPKLRFGEFEEEWLIIESNIQIIAGNAYSLNDYQDKGAILIQGLNITPGKLDVSNANYISLNHNAKHIFVSYGDILIGLNRPIINGELKVCKYDLNNIGYLYQRAGKLQFNHSEIYSEFLYQYLRSDKFLNDTKNELVGSDQPYVRSNLFQVIKLIFPSIPEQQKIASFLSAVDEKIQLLTRKKELLENYKKGAMQQLFSGNLRFKDENGKDYPAWEEKRLSHYLKVSKLKNIDNKYDKSDVLSVSGEFGIVNQIEFQGRSFAGESVHNYGVVLNGDIVYTKSPLKANPYGIIKVNKGANGIVSTLYAVYNCKPTLNGEYLDYYFQLNENTNSYLRPLVQKGSKNDMKINNEKVLIDPILIPSIVEQNNIVKFIKELDTKIEYSIKELNQTQTYKKGLLQKMFV